MARNASGAYTLPSGNPVVTDTTVTSTWANATMTDVATEMTASLSRTGKGGMLAPLKTINGTAGAPVYTFTNFPTSGWYIAGAGDVRMSITGTDRLKVLATGIEVIGAAGTEAQITSKTVQAATETVNFKALATGGAISQKVGVSFFPTFGSGSDTGPRRAADIWSGFDGGTWGNEYLIFGVGSAGSNDSQDVTVETLKLTGAGAEVTGQVIIDGGTGVDSSGVLQVRQNGDGVGNGIAITSSSTDSTRIWKAANGDFIIGTSTANNFVQELDGDITLLQDINMAAGKTVDGRDVSVDGAKLDNNYAGTVPVSTGTGTVSGNSGFTYSWAGNSCTITHNLNFSSPETDACYTPSGLRSDRCAFSLNHATNSFIVSQVQSNGTFSADRFCFQLIVY
jgi:hypothetical protein